jgi:DNA-binding IclR family transcriptional regulator
MRELRDRIEESVFLGVRHGHDVTILDTVESTRELKITAPVGTRIPLLAGATGKVFLASMDEPEVSALLAAGGLRRYTEHSIVERDRYIEELGRVRRDGFATDREEYLSGVSAVASRIDLDGGPSSAIWVVGFTASMDETRMRLVSREITSTARAIAGTRG